MVAHSLWVRGAVGSNPATPTSRRGVVVRPRPCCLLGRRPERGAIAGSLRVIFAGDVFDSW